ncbi:MAG: tRNA (5-methylaminomethyl-2-thiouridine)(34)-methyltransferase MnmD [Dissulfurispiraceae bacterium]|jgi:tRNA 5-methylaminomethyl-2-thiouridine biosynthesis bifunctional protein|nr:tRNA (5-methylaminomethyl-2-thiouridine)(34)-methyltransferase MnmD [Dissulfurispiraceae bacterium]
MKNVSENIILRHHILQRAAMQIPDYLMNRHYNDRYFDVVNAIEEAKHIFFDGTDIISRLSLNRQLNIGETGFGAGRVVIALMDYLEGRSINGLSITYNTAELHPVTAAQMSDILDDFKKPVGHLIEQFIHTYSSIDISVHGWHEIEIKRPFGSIKINLWIGEALEMVNALHSPCDVWFLDGHAPKKNPDIWRHELLMAIGEKTVSGGACATYTVAGAVRRSLAKAGFEVQQRPGAGGKKAVLKGIRQ